jgi:signal transduction histidine kinase
MELSSPIVLPAEAAAGPVMLLAAGAIVLPAIQPRLAVPAVVEALAPEAFAWTLAHELRQPLAVLSSAVALVRQDAPSEATLRATEIMARQIRQMSRMIEDLVDSARLANGKVSLILQRVDLRDVLKEAAADVTTDVAAQHHVLEVHFGTRPLWVRADVQRLHQVFSNLLRNAIKYTEPGGRIALTLEATHLTVTARVLDTGRGIASPALVKIFDLFAQVAPDDAGVGIGLNVVKEIVALHSGWIEALSDGPGKGSEFVVVLPRVD